MLKLFKQKTAITKITWSSVILLLFSVYIINSCKNKCDCTNYECPCQDFFITIYANANNAGVGSYSTKEIDSFYLLRTNENFQLIDSIKMNFEELLTSADFNKEFILSTDKFPDMTDLRQYSFIIKNTELKTADTISSISYTEELEKVVCNVCTNCDDEYVLCNAYKNISLELNCCIINKPAIELLRAGN